MATYVPGLQNQDWSSAGGGTGGLGQVALMYGLDKAGLMDFSNPATRKSISQNGLLGHFASEMLKKPTGASFDPNAMGSWDVANSAPPPAGIASSPIQPTNNQLTLNSPAGIPKTPDFGVSVNPLASQGAVAPYADISGEHAASQYVPEYGKAPDQKANMAGLGSSVSGFDPDLLDAGVSGFSDMLGGDSLLALFA